MLKGEANFWWESTEAREENIVIPWYHFKELFFELKQGNMSLAEYELRCASSK